ncbi:unnamed protein product [Mucor hiemalis]
MSIISNLFTFLIIVPIVPLIAYVIGLLVPASHIVSRSSTFKIKPQRLWTILTDVSKYPQWQPKIEKVLIDETSGDETVFVEYSIKKRHTVIIHHERIANKCLLRILEERPIAAAPVSSKIPTFSGSWTFDISQEKEDDDQVTLKITEQGVIKKPLVRVTHLLMFGFHSRIDRFLNDLHKKIDADNREMSLEEFDEKKVQQLDTSKTQVSIEEELSEDREFSIMNGSVQRDNGDQQQVFYSTVLNSLPSDQINNKDDNALSAMAITDDSQQLEANDTLMTESKVADKEWDLMSEIYERPAKTNSVAKTFNASNAVDNRNLAIAPNTPII